MYLRDYRAFALVVDMREDNIKMELEEIAHATVVWTEVNLIET